MPQKPKPLEFVIDENGCHICTSHPSGKMRVNGKNVQTHQYVYRTQVGEIPEGMVVIRTCFNTKCINPDHLALCTWEELGALTAKNPSHHTRGPRPIDFEVDPITGCFNCTSHTVGGHGYYHVIMVNNKRYLLHRFVYEQCFGEIPDGMVVRHKCDNHHCINPEHLELGTMADNMRDRNERGRQAKGSKIWTAKLTEEDVREIRKRLATGETCTNLARIYGVSHRVISDIKLRKTWKHVD